jgi:hypothetical protein
LHHFLYGTHAPYLPPPHTHTPPPHTPYLRQAMMQPACSPTSTGLLHSFAASSLQARAICVQTSAHPAATSIAPAATTTKPDSAITWLQVPHYIISCMVRTPPPSPPPTPPHPPYLRQAMMLPACSPTSTGLLHSVAASSLQARAAQHTAHITHHMKHTCAAG